MIINKKNTNLVIHSSINTAAHNEHASHNRSQSPYLNQILKWCLPFLFSGDAALYKKELANCRVVCKTWKQIVSTPKENPRLWKLFQTLFFSKEEIIDRFKVMATEKRSKGGGIQKNLLRKINRGLKLSITVGNKVIKNAEYYFYPNPWLQSGSTYLLDSKKAEIFFSGLDNKMPEPKAFNDHMMISCEKTERAMVDVDKDKKTPVEIKMSYRDHKKKINNLPCISMNRPMLTTKIFPDFKYKTLSGRSTHRGIVNVLVSHNTQTELLLILPSYFMLRIPLDIVISNEIIMNNKNEEKSLRQEMPNNLENKDL